MVVSFVQVRELSSDQYSIMYWSCFLGEKNLVDTISVYNSVYLENLINYDSINILKAEGHKVYSVTSQEFTRTIVFLLW